MIKKKICMLGAFAVGKTSLTRRYAYSLFSPRYLTTVGVEIHRKRVQVDGQGVQLLLWDLAGEDDMNEVRPSHLRGASGYVLTIDPTRPATLRVAQDLQRRVELAVGPLPFVVALNKADRRSEWDLNGAVERMRARGWTVGETSALTGGGVDELFVSLARDTFTHSVI